MRTQAMLTKLWVAQWLIVLVMLFHSPFTAAADAIDRFIGRYQGHATFDDAGDEVKRDLDVVISKTKRGFNVNWKAVTLKPGGRLKTKEYAIDFVPTARDGVFESAMKTNMFGKREPLNPMKGEPYVWGRITGDTLTVFALLINDDGGYELQVYDRTLTVEGLQLEYARIRDGKQLKTINTLLRRQ